MREQITMEEPASWRGHSFTLFVFGGIVVLCAIFFVLGMLVGRTQGQRIAEMASAEASAKKISATDTGTGPELTFYKTVEAPELKADVPLETPPPSEQAANDPPPAAPEAAAGLKIFLQIAALREQKDAERELANVKSKGFPSALILSPSAQSADRLYRIQVGPYNSEEDVAIARRELESKGFKQVFVKR